MNHFSVRTFSLFIGTACDSTFDLLWMNKQPMNIIPNDFSIIWRNVIVFVSIGSTFGLCILNDRFRGKSLMEVTFDGTDETDETDETESESLMDDKV